MEVSICKPWEQTQHRDKFTIRFLALLLGHKHSEDSQHKCRTQSNPWLSSIMRFVQTEKLYIRRCTVSIIYNIAVAPVEPFKGVILRCWKWCRDLRFNAAHQQSLGTTGRDTQWELWVVPSWPAGSGKQRYEGLNASFCSKSPSALTKGRVKFFFCQMLVVVDVVVLQEVKQCAVSGVHGQTFVFDDLKENARNVCWVGRTQQALTAAGRRKTLFSFSKWLSLPAC